MDGLQTQINELNYKIDQLHEIVDRVSLQITELASEQQRQSNNEMEMYPGTSRINRRYSSSQKTSDLTIEHKDILSDGSGDGRISTKSEQTLSPDIQIRRLTAQLTAAYNRIAALEEQLLACRIQS